MATKDETNTGKLASFSSIKDSERRAVILRSEGKSMEQITAHINNEFALEYAVSTIREWFFAGGRLDQAYMEYNEAKAEMALKEARQIIKKASSAAAANLVRKVGSSDERISLDASRHLLNKYIPDRQVVQDAPDKEASLPDELLASVKDLQESDNGQEPVDEPPVGDPDPATPGE